MCHCFTFLLMDRAEDGRLDDDTEECQSLFVYTAAHHHSGRSIMRKRRTDRDSPGVSRRHFVSSTAAAAFAGAFGPRLFAAAATPRRWRRSHWAASRSWRILTPRWPST